MAMTSDGKIATRRREAARFTTENDLRRLEQQVAWADVLIIAAGTVRAYGTTFRVHDGDLALMRRQAGQSVQPMTIVVTRSLDLPADLPFFTTQDISRIIATTDERADDARIAFGQCAEVIGCGTGSVDVRTLVSSLVERGWSRLLLLGGGTLNAEMLSAGLVDEALITIAPWIFGGKEAPTIADGEGLDDSPVKLELVSCEVEGDEIFTRYLVRSSD